MDVTQLIQEDTEEEKKENGKQETGAAPIIIKA